MSTRTIAVVDRRAVRLRPVGCAVEGGCVDMSLAVESRILRSVYVVKCAGRIVSGEESKVLDEALQRGLREFNRVVLNLAEVKYIDSAGMGLLVRFLWHLRNRHGDLRLAEPAPFVTSLLAMTKLSTVFQSYSTEEAAIVSFLQESVQATTEAQNSGPRVLFLDPTADTVCVRPCCPGAPRLSCTLDWFDGRRQDSAERFIGGRDRSGTRLRQCDVDSGDARGVAQVGAYGQRRSCWSGSSRVALPTKPEWHCWSGSRHQRSVVVRERASAAKFN